MSYKIACHGCGQHFTVEADQTGEEYECTTCGATFMVPDEVNPTAAGESFAASLAALGVRCDLPADLSAEDAEIALDNVLCAIANLKSDIEDWLNNGEINRFPDDEELIPVFNEVFACIVHRDTAPGDDEKRAWVAEAVRGLFGG